MTKAAVTYLVCYDVCTLHGRPGRRLARVRRTLRAVGTPVQYSVFAARLTPAGRRALMADLAGCIDPGVDDVRLYPLPAAPWFCRMGRTFLPEGVHAPLPGRDGIERTARRESL